MFLFLFSIAEPRTILQRSFSLLFLLNYIFFIHPIGHVQVAFCLNVKTSLNAKPFIWLPPAGSLTHFYVKCLHKTRFETETKGNIHPWAAHRSFNLSTLFLGSSLCCYFTTVQHEFTLPMNFQGRGEVHWSFLLAFFYSNGWSCKICFQLSNYVSLNILISMFVSSNVPFVLSVFGEI